jgi:hypothetical protein
MIESNELRTAAKIREELTLAQIDHDAESI